MVYKVLQSLFVFTVSIARGPGPEQVSNSPGGTPYIQMIGIIVVFLGVVIGYLVFFRGCSTKIL